MRQKFVWISVIEIGTVLLKLAILAALLFGVSTTVIWLVVATQASRTAGVVVRSYLSRRKMPHLKFEWRSIDLRVAKEMLNFGLWGMINQVAVKMRTDAAPIILTRFATPLDVTTFFLGAMLFRHITDGITVATQAFIPTITAMHATGQNKRLARTYIRYGRLLLWVFLLVALPLIIFRKELIDLYVGSKYADAAAVILLLMLSYGITAGNGMIFELIVAVGRIRSFALFHVATQLFNVAFSLYLVIGLGLGALGAAVGSASAMVLQHLVFFIPLGLRSTSVSLSQWMKQTVVPGLVPAIVTAAIMTPFTIRYEPDSWMSLILWSMAIVCVYLVVMFTSALKDDDRDDLQRLLAYLRARTLARTHTK